MTSDEAAAYLADTLSIPTSPSLAKHFEAIRVLLEERRALQGALAMKAADLSAEVRASTALRAIATELEIEALAREPEPMPKSVRTPVRE